METKQIQEERTKYQYGRYPVLMGYRDVDSNKDGITICGDWYEQMTRSIEEKSKIEGIKVEIVYRAPFNAEKKVAMYYVPSFDGTVKIEVCTNPQDRPFTITTELTFYQRKLRRRIKMNKCIEGLL
ncbi:hypothetical protein J4221_00245 [Candidatus Pacearchaeota archaeon]|nr:hypothetical protein [Candidatus Pacearchaeota archaeon]